MRRSARSQEDDAVEGNSTFEGLWWLPESPEQRFPGRLTFSSESGGVLEVWDELCSCDGRQQTDCHDTIFGLTSAAQPVTLYHCAADGRSISRVGDVQATKTAYHASFLLEGTHSRSLADAAFSSYSAEFPNLGGWMGDPESDSDWVKGDDGEVRELVIKVPVPVNSTLFSNPQFKINAYSRVGTKPRGLVEFQVEHRRLLELEFPTPYPVDKLWAKLRRVQDLLSLAFGASVYYQTLSAFERGADGVPRVIKLHRWTRDPRGAEGIPHYRMLFTLQELLTKAPDGFERWFAEKAKGIEALSPFFATLYNDELYLETKFVMLVNALESFHRRTGKNSVLPAEEHDARLGRILSAVAAEGDAAWLNDKLSRSNQPSLRERLTELCLRIAPVVERFESGSEAFIARVSNTRHYLVHYDPSLEAKASKDVELIGLTRRVEAVCVALLLNELGFPVDDLPRMLSRSARYRGAVR